MLAVADLHSKILDARPPWGSKFFRFHAVFGKNWQNRMLAPPPGSWRPLLGEILDPPLARYLLKAKKQECIPVGCVLSAAVAMCIPACSGPDIQTPPKTE